MPSRKNPFEFVCWDNFKCRECLLARGRFSLWWRSPSFEYTSYPEKRSRLTLLKILSISNWFSNLSVITCLIFNHTKWMIDVQLSKWLKFLRHLKKVNLNPLGGHHSLRKRREIDVLTNNHPEHDACIRTKVTSTFLSYKQPPWAWCRYQDHSIQYLLIL